MGNCTCLKAVDRTESRYADTEFEITIDEILANIISSRNSFNRISGAVDDVTINGDNSDTENLERPSNISFERESDVDRLEDLYVGEETCTICAYAYDEDQHTPRILPCGHTFCNYCIMQMGRKSNYAYVACPLDRKCHRIKQQHSVRPLFNPHYSRTPSIASESFNSDTLFDVDVDLDQNNESLSENFEQTHLDSTSNEENVNSIIDSSASPVPSHFEIYNTERQMTGTDHADFEVQVHVHSFQQNSDIENEALENENNDTNSNPVFVADLNTMSSGLQQQPVSVNAISQMWTKRPNGNDDKFGAFNGAVDESMGQVVGYPDLVEDIVIKRKKRQDLYDDERSVRSFEWVEPDYSSESE